MPVALTAVLLALEGQAVAVRVNYDAPAECPNAAAFYDAVRARTDHVRPALGEEPRLDVSVRVTGEARRFAGEVREVVNGKESAVRAMDGETCKEVVEALSLTVALSIDPNAHAPSPTPASTQATPPPPSAGTNAGCKDVVNAPVAAHSEPAAGAAPLRLELGVGALGTWLDSGGLSLGGTVSATVLRALSPSTGSSVRLGFLFASNGFPSASAEHRSQFGGLSLDACPWRHRVGDVELAPCALASFGVLEVTGRGVPDAKTVDRVWWSAGLDAQFAWLLGQGWVFDGALGGSVPLVRRRYFTGNSDHVIAETPRVSPLLRLGVAFRF